MGSVWLLHVGRLACPDHDPSPKSAPAQPPPPSEALLTLHPWPHSSPSPRSLLPTHWLLMPLRLLPEPHPLLTLLHTLLQLAAHHSSAPLRPLPWGLHAGRVGDGGRVGPQREEDKREWGLRAEQGWDHGQGTHPFSSSTLQRWWGWLFGEAYIPLLWSLAPTDFREQWRC